MRPASSFLFIQLSNSRVYLYKRFMNNLFFIWFLYAGFPNYRIFMETMQERNGKVYKSLTNR